jgi:hypothetical protein
MLGVLGPACDLGCREMSRIVALIASSRADGMRQRNDIHQRRAFRDRPRSARTVRLPGGLIQLPAHNRTVIHRRPPARPGPEP